MLISIFGTDGILYSVFIVGFRCCAKPSVPVMKEEAWRLSRPCWKKASKVKTFHIKIGGLSLTTNLSQHCLSIGIDENLAIPIALAILLIFTT